jgi:hypothetical protein
MALGCFTAPILPQRTVVVETQCTVILWYHATTGRIRHMPGTGTDERPPEQQNAATHGFHIKIDRTEYTVHQSEMTGAELRQVPPAHLGPDRDLFEVVPGHPDRKIENDTVVEISNGKRFFTAPAHINPGTRAL